MIAVLVMKAQLHALLFGFAWAAVTPLCVAGSDDGVPILPSRPERNGTTSTNTATYSRRPGSRAGLAHRPNSADATNRVIVQFKSGLSRQDMEKLLTSVASVVSVSQDRFHSDRFLVTTPDTDPDAAADRLAQLSGVAWAERDERVICEARFLPSDSLFTNQWYLCNTGQGGGLTNRDISAVRAWDITQGTSSVVIAILDDGVDMTHPDLASNVFINAGEYGGGKETNGIDDDHDGYIDDWRGWDFLATNNDPSPKLAGDNHGTAMAGIAAAMIDNDIGIAGIAGRCKFLPIRILSTSATGSDWANAIEYAARFANVIVIGASFPPANVVYDALDYAMVTGRGGKGCVICAALGNNGVRRRYTADAAAAAEVLTVSGVSCFDKRSWFADYGPALNLVAPAGGGAPDSQALITTDRVGAPGYSNADYIVQQGTSFACALAGGTAALVISKNPSLTGLEVRRILEMSCDKVDAEACPYDKRGWNEQYGFGRINAWAALTTPLPATWDSYEPDDSPTQAATLVDGELQYRSLESGSSVDWAQFAVSNASADLLISVLGTTNAWLRLYDGATNLIAQDNRGYPSYSYIWTNLVKGSYFVRVESPDKVPIPEYGLDLELQNMPDEYEPDDSTNTAKTIVPRQMQFRTLYPAGNTDWATFTLTSNTYVEIRTMGEATGWLELSVWNKSGSRIGYNYNTNVTACFTNQLPPATYWISVDDPTGWPLSSYQLLLETYDTDPYESDNTTNTAKTIHSGDRLTHTIYPAYDTDWLKFTLTDTSRVLILTDTMDPLIADKARDTVLTLYRAATGLVFLAENDDGNDHFFSAISRANLDPGDYYIKVTSYSNSVVCENFYVSLDVLPQRVLLSGLTQRTNGYEVAWPGNASFNYKVQYASNLVGTQVWTTATNLEGVIGTNRWLDNGAVSNIATPYFYRIVTE